jgi:gliding motility-associated-like protein
MKKHILLFFVLTLQMSFQIAFAQGGDTQATASGLPITLPFSASGSTIGAVDNVNDVTSGIAFGAITGPDWLYYFCATSTTPIVANIDFPVDPVNGVYSSITIWDGDPNTTGNFIAYTSCSGLELGNCGTVFTPIVGQCYYVMVDNWPLPNGFNYNITIQQQPIPPVLPIEPTCSNMGFEDGNFTGWQGSWSHIVTTSSAGSPTPNYTPLYFNTSSNQHALMTGAGLDPVAGFPVVCPGQGTYSLRLGDGLLGDKGGATIQQKFMVAASNALFTYKYAVIVEDGGFGGGTPHNSTNQPFFKVEIFNSSGVEIPCGQFFVTGGPGIPGFTQIPNSGVYFKNWDAVFVDLTAYIGSFVTVKYTVNDCSLGAHACYAYIDAECAPMTVIPTTYICTNGAGTVTSPLTGSTYSWTVQGNPTVLGTAQSLSVSPLVATTYECVITNASGCPTTLFFPVDIYPPSTVTSTSATICSGESATLVGTGSSAGGTYSWSPSGGALATTSALNPTTTTVYTCTYTDPNGCGSSGTGTITVNPLPLVPITAPIVYCQNAVAVTLTATPSAGCTLNWYGTNVTGGTASPTGPTPITTSTGSTTYYVSQTNASGCEGPRASLVVTINALPTITVNSPTICPNATALLTASGGTTYEWEGTPALTINPYSVNPAVTTTYTVVGTTNGCSNSVVATVTVANVLSVTVNSPTICNGSTAVLTAVGAAFYEWEGNPGLTSNPYSVSPSVTTTYSVVGTTNGCTGSTTATVTVNPIPTTTAGSNSPICTGVSLNLTAVASVVPGATYSWTGPNGFTSALQNPTIAAATVAAAGSYIVTVSANGCSSTNSVVVVVNPVPVTTAAANTPCEGNALNLTAVTSAVPGATYSWTGPNGFTSTIQNPNIPASTMADAGSYTVTVLANGCSSPSTVVAVIKPIPTTTAGSNSPICAGTALNLTAVSSVVPGSTYSWTGPNGFTSGLQNPSIPGATVAASGSYTVTVLAAGCSSPSSVLVVVNASPTTTASSTPICAGSNLLLAATTFAGGTYSWIGPNGFTSTVQNPVVPAATINASGNYTVTVISNGCSFSSSVVAVVSTPATPIFTPLATICQNDSPPSLPAASLNNPAIVGTWSPNLVSNLVGGNYTFTPNANQCALATTLSIVVNPLPILPPLVGGQICEPGTIDLTATSVTPGASGGDFSYWTNAACTSPLSNPSAVGVGGTYYIQSTSATVPACSVEQPVFIVINPLPLASFTPSPSVLSSLSPYSVMVNNSIDADAYTWDFGDGQTSTLTSPDHYFPDSDSATYLITLTVLNSITGCVDTAYATVVVNEELIFYAPNTFTPDKDLNNEIFSPIFTSGYDPYDYTLYIYNRWGELIFESHDVNVGWRGTYGPENMQVQDGTYTWKIDFKLKSDGQNKVVVGHVNVLR